mgnify:CR=1 FL=1
MHLMKDRKVFVEGNLKFYRWNDSDGKLGNANMIRASKVLFLDSKK